MLLHFTHTQRSYQHYTTTTTTHDHHHITNTTERGLSCTTHHRHPHSPMLPSSRTPLSVPGPIVSSTVREGGFIFRRVQGDDCAWDLGSGVGVAEDYNLEVFRIRKSMPFRPWHKRITLQRWRNNPLPQRITRIHSPHLPFQRNTRVLPYPSILIRGETRGGGRVYNLVRSEHNGVVGVYVGCGDGCDGGRLARVVGYPVGQLNFAHEAGYAACGEVRSRGGDF